MMARASRKNLLLYTLMISTFLSPLNVNFTSVALPTIRTYFQVSVEQVSWIGTAYFIPTVVLMPLQASLGQRVGVRKLYILGLLLLAVGALLSASAANFSWLLASRVLQGIGWSALYPLALILIRRHFQKARQGEVMGAWESAAGAAAVIGPALGGGLIMYLGWQSTYLLLGLIAAAGCGLGFVFIPKTETRNQSKPLDWGGMVFLTSALFFLLMGIARQSLWLLLPGLPLLYIWQKHANEVDHPFVHPSIFKNRTFTTASFGAMLRILIGLAAVMSLPLFLEDVRGLSPAMIGLILPLYSLFLFLGARPGGRWADAAGSRKPSATGFILMIAGLVVLAVMDTRTSLLLIAAAMIVRGVGSGISQAPFARAATGAFPESDSAMASGMYGMLRYSGLALGSILVGVFLESRLAFYGSDGMGASAVPAFQELFGVLAVIGLVGLALSLMMRKEVIPTPGIEIKA